MAIGPGGIVVLAKAPVAGTVKTRLAPLLGDDGCARLQAALIRQVLAVAGEVGPVHLAVHPPGARPDFRVPVLDQRGDDLGARMAAAVTDVHALRGGPVLMLGADVPTLTPAVLLAALAALAGRDVVFGPALDGGYYLVGVHRPQPALFATDPALWGTGAVLTAGLAAARATGLATALLDPLRDLDTPADAAALRTDPALPPALGALLG